MEGRENNKGKDDRQEMRVTNGKKKLDKYWKGRKE